MHAISRLVLHPLIPNIQASWVKLGPAGAAAALRAGVNDLGGTLMNESISRAAGTAHGEDCPPAAMQELIRAAERTPRQRTTLYDSAPGKQTARSFAAPPLSPRLEPPPRRGAPSRMAGLTLVADGSLTDPEHARVPLPLPSMRKGRTHGSDPRPVRKGWRRGLKG
jgi:hypothetical protein